MADVDVDFTKDKPTADGTKMEAMVIRKEDGNGTVPLISAQFTGATSARGRDQTFKVKHATCFGDAKLRQTVIANVRQLLKP